jgi:hypothetical protein
MSSLSDENALLLMVEFGKVDKEAMKLLLLLQDSKDFGEKDMVLNRIHYYLKGRANA